MDALHHVPFIAFTIITQDKSQDAKYCKETWWLLMRLGKALSEIGEDDRRATDSYMLEYTTPLLPSGKV
jgi:hypothetical protein